jgi:aconitate hydratase
MGVLPLEFLVGEGAGPLGLKGDEIFAVEGLDAGLAPRGEVRLRAQRGDGTALEFGARVRIDTPSEIEIYRHGGILHMVLRRMLEDGS